MSCGVGRRGSDSSLLCLWRRLAAIALIRPLAWEHPYATGVALEKATKKTNKQKKQTWRTQKDLCAQKPHRALLSYSRGPEASPFHLSAHPGSLPLRWHMNSALAEAQSRDGSATTAVRRGEAGSQRHLQPLAAPWSRRGTISSGRTRSYPLLGEGTHLRPLASPTEGLTLTEPV